MRNNYANGHVWSSMKLSRLQLIDALGNKLCRWYKKNNPFTDQAVHDQGKICPIVGSLSLQSATFASAHFPDSAENASFGKNHCTTPENHFAAHTLRYRTFHSKFCQGC